MSKNQKPLTDYMVDYENGKIPIGELSIGSRVVDPSWAWEFRTGEDYSGSGEVKPVIWIVVAKNHYDGLDPHITLLAEELIGLYIFDNGSNWYRNNDGYGFNDWGESGYTYNATIGLRPWLNSNGIHSDEGFYQVFSDSFKEVVINTTVSNRLWEEGRDYITKDNIYIPSTTELGDTTHNNTYCIGSTFPYFKEADDTRRQARIGGKTEPYWTRSPDFGGDGFDVQIAYSDSVFDTSSYASSNYGVRPVVNIKANVFVSKTVLYAQHGPNGW